MMGALYEDTVEQELTLPWRVICVLACHALVERKSLDQLIEEALTEYLNK